MTFAFGKDHAVGIADPDVVGVARRRAALGISGTTSFGLLVAAQAEEAGVAHDTVGGELGEGDLGDQLRLHPMRAARLRARHFGGGGLALPAARNFAAARACSGCEKPVPTLPA